MARKPSERRNFREPGMDLNLTPMMNMIAILIPALLISVAFIEIATLEAVAPSGSNEGVAPDTMPLNLTVSITERGYHVATRELPGDDAPEIPVVNRPIACQRYLGTTPPPRARNVGVRPCGAGDGDRAFWVYDVGALRDTLGVIKDDHPDARRIVIVADPGISYEAITDVMDASREREDGALFDEVLLSPTL